MSWALPETPSSSRIIPPDGSFIGPRRSWSSRARGRSTTCSSRYRQRTDRDERVLVTTLTKKMAEELTEFLTESRACGFGTCTPMSTLFAGWELLRELRPGRLRPVFSWASTCCARASTFPRLSSRGDSRCRQGGLPPLFLFFFFLIASATYRSIQTHRSRRGATSAGRCTCMRHRHKPSMAQAIDETTRRRDQPDRLLQHRDAHRSDTAAQGALPTSPISSSVRVRTLPHCWGGRGDRRARTRFTVARNAKKETNSCP